MAASFPLRPGLELFGGLGDQRVRTRPQIRFSRFRSGPAEAQVYLARGDLCMLVLLARDTPR